MNNFSSPAWTAPAVARSRDASAFQRRLACFNAQRIAPSQPTADWRTDIEHDAQMRLQEGALMRLVCGARCFERDRAELWRQHSPVKTQIHAHA